MNFLILLIGCLTCLTGIDSIMFTLPPNYQKCLREEIHKDILVTGEYEVSEAPGQHIKLIVTDSKGHILYQKENSDTGKFAFTTEEYDMFDVCFQSRLTEGATRGINRDVKLLMKRGVEAKDYQDIAKAEKLKPLEVELKKLEDLSESIVNDFAYMRSREEEMRDTNESTHSRVLYFSVISMGCLLGLATWQVVYLRRYFKSKKLIE